MRNDDRNGGNNPKFSAEGLECAERVLFDLSPEASIDGLRIGLIDGIALRRRWLCRKGAEP